MTEKTRKLLTDAINACTAAEGFVAGLTFGQYESNLLLRSAVERQLEILGEALHRALKLEPELERDIPNVHRAIAVRNRIVHGYDVVDDEIVWDILEHFIVPLKSSLQSMI